MAMSRKPWGHFWRAAARAAAFLVFAAAAGSAQADDRPVPPDFVSAWYSFMEDDPEYRACVEPRKRAALQTMWARRAPLEAAITEISLAYRNCAGFELFWPVLYHAGFDSPEGFITLELALAKASARKLLERFDDDEDDRARAIAMEDAGPFLADAALLAESAQFPAALRGHLAERIFEFDYARRALGRGRTLNLLARPRMAQMIEQNAEHLAYILPDNAVSELEAALAFAMDNRTPERATRGLAESMRR